MSQYIAVVDFGKTNKKVLIFDENLKIIDSAYKAFDETIKDGIHYETVKEATEWTISQLKIFSAKYSISSLSITTHGATAVCIDKNGDIAVPTVAYTTEAGDDFDKRFYDKFGSETELQEETGSAKIGSMINIAKVLFFISEKWPEKYKNIDTILNYPQYLGYLFTGNKGAEPTFVGCHSYLYNPKKKIYSSVAEKLGIVEKLPAKISKSWEVLGTVTPQMSQKTGLSEDCIVTMGIHDSNSSLLPYLVKGHENFVLNSTGTWCVAMHPTKTISFDKNELGKLVFFNLDAFYNPVKTSIFMGGLEFQTYMDILKEINNTKEFPEFDENLCAEVIKNKDIFILPSVVKGTGIFPNAEPKVIENGEVFTLEDIKSKKRIPDFFKDIDLAGTVLNISLAIQTKSALDMVGFDGVGKIFTEGGFRANDTYNRILTALYPNSKVLLTGLTEATAFGAALLAKSALTKTTPMETADTFEIETSEVPKFLVDGIDEYVDKFNELIDE